MTNEIKKNKELRIFTFILVTLTGVGILTIFLKTEYAKLYKIWFIKRYKQIHKIYDSLTLDQKKELHSLITKGKDKTEAEAAHALSLAGVSTENSIKIVKAGSYVVRKILTEIKKLK